MELPENVLRALFDGQKIEAIKLLREQRNLSLKEAKALVDEYICRPEFRLLETGNSTQINRADKKTKTPFMALLVLAAFVWAMVNIIEVAGSVIILLNHESYQQVSFTINKVHYNDDHESGLTWGFIGSLPDREARMYAPNLADAKALGYQKLRQMYPVGTQMQVLYSPTVTQTLYQHRTLNIIPYTPDLVAAERAVIYGWLVYCLLPLVGVLLIARTTNKR